MVWCMETITNTEARYRGHEDHQLTIVQDVTVESAVTVDDNGDIRQEHAMDIVDTQQSIWCSSCGLLDLYEYDEHGISQDWQLYG